MEINGRAHRSPLPPTPNAAHLTNGNASAEQWAQYVDQQNGHDQVIAVELCNFGHNENWLQFLTRNRFSLAISATGIVESNTESQRKRLTEPLAP